MGKYRVGLYTLGCKVSQYETQAVSEEFERLGFEVAPFDEPCHVYVINTCTVTAESDRKSRQFIRRAVRMSPSAVIIAMGCSVQRESDTVARIKGVSYLCGTAGKMKVAQKALQLLAEKERKSNNSPETPAENTPVCDVTSLDGAEFEPMTITRASRTRVYVKIEDGCECRCSYCAIPDARGPVRSKPIDQVTDEVQTLVRGGTGEVVLSGIEIASYGRDFGDGTSLTDLLWHLEHETDISRIRISSLTPEVLTEDFIGRISSLHTVAHHFHLSIQSGCDRTLRAMRRRYLTADVLRSMEHMRQKMPDVQFTADLMVGFPGETEQDFLETLEFLRLARFLYIHIFIYSRRAGTPAAQMPGQIPPDIGHDRSLRASALRDSIRHSIMAQITEQKTPLSAVLETEENGSWHGHSDTFMPVVVESKLPLHGEECLLEPLRLEGDAIICRLIKQL